MKKPIKSALSILLAVLIAISVPFAVSAVEAESYTVTLAQDSKVTYSGVSGSSFDIKSTTYRSIYAKVVNELKDEYYVDSIETAPENAADVTFYENTGEVFIENVKSDFELTPVVKSKTAAETLSVTWDFVKDGVYSEDNAAATVQFTVDVKDGEGNPAVGAKLYYKSDKAEKSFTNAATTDKNGQATFKHAYALEEGKYEADFTAQFATDSKFTQNLEESSLKVVLQKQTDLYLTTDQVKASRTNNNNDGGVINVNPKYEYFTGALHQKAINTASGKWVTPDNGTISGLAPGQYALRFKEYVEGNTIYLHSDYDYFTIDRAIWTATANVENSSNVTFADSVLYAAPGGDVFFYVTPDEGYEITSYSVNKPSYISDIVYNEEDGYIWIKGVTGSISLTVKAESASEAEPVVAKFDSKSLKASALGIAEPVGAVNTTDATGAGAYTGAYIKIEDVYQDFESTITDAESGYVISIKFTVYDANGNPVSLKEKDSNATIYYRSGTGSFSSRTGTTTSPTKFEFVSGGTAVFSFKLSTSNASASAPYTGKANEAYITYKTGDTTITSEHLTFNAYKQFTGSIVLTPSYQSNGLGRILVTSEYYGEGYRYKEWGQSAKYKAADGNVLTDLQVIEGNTDYWVISAYIDPFVENKTDFNVRVGATTHTYLESAPKYDGYYVVFVNAAGKTVSSQLYSNGATVTSVPNNTPDDDDYTYSWPTIGTVTKDVTYREVKKEKGAIVEKSTTTALTSALNETGNGVDILVQVTDEDSNAVADKEVTLNVGGTTSTVTLDENGQGKYVLVPEEAGSLNTTISAAFAGSEDAETVLKASEASITVSITKPVAPAVETKPSVNGVNGTLKVTSDIVAGTVYVDKNNNEIVISNNNEISLPAGTYSVYVTGADLGSNSYRVASDVSIAEIEEQINNIGTTYKLYTGVNVDIILEDGSHVDSADIQETTTVVNGETVSAWLFEGVLKFDDQVTVKATGATAWKIGSTYVAYGETYTFRIASDVAVFPVYDDIVSTEPSVTIVSVTKRTDTHQVQFYATITTSSEYTVEKYGFVYGKNPLLSDLDIDKATQGNVLTTGNGDHGIVKFIEKDRTSNQLTLYYGIKEPATGDYVGARAYIIFKDTDGNEKTVYSNAVAYQYPIELV